VCFSGWSWYVAVSSVEFDRRAVLARPLGVWSCKTDVNSLVFLSRTGAILPLNSKKNLTKEIKVLFLCCARALIKREREGSNIL
jgi:hypothetical protein